jgi:uncharacterized membrane protein YphA (DoxX/SURF4 family)
MSMKGIEAAAGLPPAGGGAGEMWAVRAALLALAAPFLLSAATKAMDFAGATAEFRALAGLEPAWLGALAVIGVQLGGSLLLVAGGRWTWLGAALLAIFVAAATLLAHAWWTKLGIDRTRDWNASGSMPG